LVTRIANAAQIPRHISPQSVRYTAITNALGAGVPLLVNGGVIMA
jgi:hypothetical protein